MNDLHYKPNKGYIVTLNLKPAITRLTAAEVRVLVSRARSVEIGGGGGGHIQYMYELRVYETGYSTSHTVR